MKLIDWLIRNNEIDWLIRNNEIDWLIKNNEIGWLIRNNEIDWLIRNNEIDWLIKNKFRTNWMIIINIIIVFSITAPSNQYPHRKSKKSSSVQNGYRKRTHALVPSPALVNGVDSHTSAVPSTCEWGRLAHECRPQHLWMGSTASECRPPVLVNGVGKNKTKKRQHAKKWNMVQ